jgi:membrane protein DedA with SNARE-associated domain
MEQRILEFITNIYQTLGWPGLVLMMAIESACIPLPSEIIMPLAGWMLIADRGLGIGFIFLAALFGGIGNVIGSLVAYWVGAKGGVPLLMRWGKYILIFPHDIERANRWFSKYGDRITFISRLLPAVRTFISLPAGIARMNIWKFIAYAFLGSFIWSAALAYGGYVLGQNWERLREVMRPFDYPIIAVVVILIGIFIWSRLRHRSSLQKLETSGASPVKSEIRRNNQSPDSSISHLPPDPHEPRGPE